jgi:aspartate/methionine/tyrosine aminotransferase
MINNRFCSDGRGQNLSHNSVPGAAFGSDDFIRFSFATSMEIIDEGMKRLKEALAKLS